jgi:hypothetical protein
MVTVYMITFGRRKKGGVLREGHLEEDQPVHSKITRWLSALRSPLVTKLGKVPRRVISGSR